MAKRKLCQANTVYFRHFFGKTLEKLFYRFFCVLPCGYDVYLPYPALLRFVKMSLLDCFVAAGNVPPPRNDDTVFVGFTGAPSYPTRRRGRVG
jgi:hypothetical protein